MPAEKYYVAVGTGPFIGIVFSWIHWLSSPDFTSGMFFTTAIFTADMDHKADDIEE